MCKYKVKHSSVMNSTTSVRTRQKKYNYKAMHNAYPQQRVRATRCSLTKPNRTTTKPNMKHVARNHKRDLKKLDGGGSECDELHNIMSSPSIVSMLESWDPHSLTDFEIPLKSRNDNSPTLESLCETILPQLFQPIQTSNAQEIAFPIELEESFDEFEYPIDNKTSSQHDTLDLHCYERLDVDDTNDNVLLKMNTSVMSITPEKPSRDLQWNKIIVKPPKSPDYEILHCYETLTPLFDKTRKYYFDSTSVQRKGKKPRIPRGSLQGTIRTPLHCTFLMSNYASKTIRSGSNALQIFNQHVRNKRTY